MPYLILPSRRTRQPQSVARANTFWLSRGLSYFSPNGGQYDAVRGLRGTIVGTRRVPSALGITTGFGTTLGAATTDLITTNSTTCGPLRTIIVWTLRNGPGGGNFGRVFDHPAGTKVETLYWDNSQAFLSYEPGYTIQGRWHPGINVGTTIGTWYCHAITIDNSSASNAPSWYIDGVAQSLTTFSSGNGGPPTAGTPLTIGNRTSDSSRNWDGLIGPFAIFDSILTDAEIKELYANIWQLAAPEQRRIYFGAGAGSGAFEIDAQAGSFALSGTAATLAKGRALDAQPGTFALSGTAATLAKNRVLDAQPGTFTLSGTAATLEKTTAGAFTIDAQPGIFAVTGTAATLARSRLFDAQPGTFTLSGTAATLEKSAAAAYSIDAQPGSFAITGRAATLSYSGASVWTDVSPSTTVWSDVSAASTVWSDI